MAEELLQQLQNQQGATINVANKIRNTSLSKKQGLMPLFELISNSIHSIEERKKAGLMGEGENGRIIVRIIRNGDPKIQEKIRTNDEYPINSIVVEDNGIGLDDENLRSFTEADTDHKLSIGGKGLGRFVCLKAFKWLSVRSTYKAGDVYKKRSINLRNTKIGFEGLEEIESGREEFRTTCILHDFIEQYQKFTPRPLAEIAAKIITHFQLYFIRKEAPNIIVMNQNGESIDLNSRYQSEFNSKVTSEDFTIGENTFTVYLSKANSAQSHRLHYCAHNRSVKEDWLGGLINELGKTSVKEGDESFYYAAFVVSKALDEYVSNERTGFNFPDLDDDEDDENAEEITLSKIRRKAVATIEAMIAEYIENARSRKIENYREVINTEMPQYRAVLTYKEDKVKKLDANLSKQELDYELYRIESDWKADIKKLGVEILEKKKDVTTMDEFKQLYDEYLTGMNEIGQSELARYIVHRKSIIDLLEILTSKDGLEDKYANEDLVHCVFFPIRTTSDVVPSDKQNLWLLDERLAYHSYLASDKMFFAMEGVEVTENEDSRPDLFILNNAFAFSEDKEAPYQSISIVEFKKPERDNYVDNDDKKNPLDQVEQYVEDLLDGKIKNRKGRTINITDKTPFYIYIVCDLTPTITKILERREFMKTPDGLGYYSFKNKRYNGYIEVLSYDKVKADARKRNQILFDKLGLPDKEW